jgi:hypothetical protein
MAANLDTPNFPIITWTSDLTGTLTVLNLDTTNTLVIDFTDGDFDTKYGFDCSNGLQASTDSIHGYLASLIQTFLQGDGSASATVTATYDFTTTPGTVRVVYALTLANDDIEFVFDSDATARQFGIRSASSFSVPTGDSERTDFNGCCYWMPYNLTCYDDRRTIAPSMFANESLSGTTIKTRRWSNERIRRALTFPYVKPAYLWSYRRQDTNYATPAAQDVDDPNNLYEHMLSAARRNNSNADATVFRIVAKTNTGAANDYRLASVVNAEALTDPGDSLQDSSGDAGLFFDVPIVFRDLGDNGTGGI